MQPTGRYGLTLKSHMSLVTAALAGQLPGRVIFKPAAHRRRETKVVAISISVSPGDEGGRERKKDQFINIFLCFKDDDTRLVICVVN